MNGRIVWPITLLAVAAYFYGRAVLEALYAVWGE